ncbi:hypothetical protein SDRG_13207 [Saprolegnia diclina VS20]|uniref:Uncharacterized protein n=1 Tax=Saprolegnia diclina (strain VS20) TaxID=1156394 RepID=T0RGY3_SAPDV|nr:hypothetical protein SDRG_13207 [Saprolegnia diclina VS20]EQC29052.1 hypothetical protein SDRG_13207 [Saprolegnia diclina VS20]|eukprot:XP_008617511.1 hypothetical protein SDRG_13207 [Saprolegnia diclina VS20]
MHHVLARAVRAVSVPKPAFLSTFSQVPSGFAQAPSTLTRPPILFNPYDALDAVLENMRLSSEPLPGMQLVGRNSRKPKKANHGKRPCSHVRRRSRRLK